MIVKFHPRGRGGGSGPVDYLLGKDRQREGASVLQGKPEEVRELIDASPYAKKYTSGVLSFAEKDLPPGQREKLMASFERVLMPGLDKDQYSVLWVEHQDKGRLELNFLIPNTELLTGGRLQPYYDRADRPRIDAWQTIVNGRLGLHDPNAPENRRALVTPSALPEAKQEAAQAITRGLLALASSGELKTRQDVTDALESAGFEVIRTTKSSISIADPDGGRNIRLKGAIYEQSFNAGEGLRAEIESAAAEYRRDAESRLQRAREVCQSGTERKREENQRRHPRPRPEAVLSHEPAHERDAAHGQPDVADHRPGLRPADRLERGHSVVAGAADTRQLHDHPGAEEYAGHTVREEQRRAALDLRRAGTPLR
ncbi:plasmid mobilization relaxase MbeA, partial [Enterobacter hormaechei]|uniref:plasmid mobilization relaxase MbeA n=1 Tax=Enterobacter hormaechei TaxID=158836 RepID=UPI001376C1EC|nr:relaxase/mobilization nuclease domain-containing protein [Enterobacter hormaechei]